MLKAKPAASPEIESISGEGNSARVRVTPEGENTRPVVEPGKFVRIRVHDDDNEDFFVGFVAPVGVDIIRPNDPLYSVIKNRPVGEVEQKLTRRSRGGEELKRTVEVLEISNCPIAA